MCTGAAGRLGPEERAIFERAARKGVLKIPRAKLDALGDEDAGKSCLGDSIMDQPYIEGRPSTKGVLMKVGLRKAVAGQQGKWQEVERHKFDEVLDQLLARGCASYSTEATAAAPPHKRRKISPAEHEVSQGEAATSAASSPMSASKVADDGCEITMGLDEFMKVLEFSEAKEALIADFMQHVEKLQHETSAIVTLMDRGGQEQYLSIHAALMANSKANASGYLVVIDITKPLDEEVNVSKFRHEEGGVIEQQREAKTRAATLRHWIAAVEAAHPPGEASPQQFLGKSHGVKRPPAVFIVITRKDQIENLGSEFVQKQEQLLRDVISESEHFADHLVPCQKDPWDVLFYVDNTKSGKGDPDPVVVQLQDMIVEMARAHSDEGEGTPLTYVMLELGLNKVSRIASNQGKVLELSNVFGLAKQVCDLSPGRECTTALGYLSNMGAICFYQEEPGLEKQIFTDPQWLGDVMSTFVTVLSRKNVPPTFWHDLAKLQREGLMTWNLATYLLHKAKVDVSVRGPILRVLQLFNIIAPSLKSLIHPQAFVNEGDDFFVPSMVLADYSKPPAYGRAIRSCAVAPPLFLCPKGFTAFLKPLFYRLISRLVTKYQYRPNVRRHQVILHLPPYLELEMAYTTSAVIATVYSADAANPPPLTILREHCRFLKGFLVEQLNQAKRRGMDGFQFEVCVHPVRNELDYEELACIDNYPCNPLINRRDDLLTKTQCPMLDLWIDEDQCEGIMAIQICYKVFN